jgi:uncharacterized membrane protein YdbT with pleckstrin-like domain
MNLRLAFISDSKFTLGGPLSYIEKNLIPGEHIVYKTGLHWVVLLNSLFATAIFAALGAFLLIRAEMGHDAAQTVTVLTWFGFALLVIAGIFVINGLVRRTATEMSVTNKRVVIKTGLGARVTYEMLLAKVESIGVEESVWGRMLGYGTVVVRGTGGTPEPFRRIGHPLEFRRQVEQQIEALTRVSPPAAPPAATSSV